MLYGLSVEYRLVPEGTGKILDLIDQGEVDLALCVTDAFVSGKSKGTVNRNSLCMKVNLIIY